MGRLGDIADLGTLILVAGGGYLLYRFIKGSATALPPIPDFGAGEEPIGIPGPALQPRYVPEPIVDIMALAASLSGQTYTPMGGPYEVF